MDSLVAGPVHLTVFRNDFRDFFRDLCREIRGDFRFVGGIKHRRYYAVKRLCVDVVSDGCRVGYSRSSGMIVFQDGAHLCKILRLGDYLFLVLIQSFLDPLGEAVIIGGVLIMFFADAAVELAGNGVRLCPKGAQLLQLVLEVILVKNVDGAGDLLEPGYREMGIQQILHQGLIFPVVDRVAIPDFYTAAHLGEEHESVLILL